MAFISNIFWNSAETRLRALWRIILQIILMVFLILLIELALSALIIVGFTQTMVSQLSLVGAPIGMVLSIWLAGRFLDKRPFRGFGLHLSTGWWRQFWFGMLLGAILMAGIFVVEYLLGYVTIVETFYVVDGNQPFLLAILIPVALFLGVGFYEELLFRGYYFRNIAEGFTFNRTTPKVAVIIAVVITSGFFGFAHASNPNATLVSSINISLAGVLLAAGLCFFDEIALPIGLHISWNFFQGNVFGFPVSGIDLIGGSFIRIEQGGPGWLTGGRFGPEAGVISLIAMSIGMLAIYGYARRVRGSAEIDPNVAIYRPKQDAIGAIVPAQD